MNTPPEPPQAPQIVPKDFFFVEYALSPLMEKLQKLTKLDCFFWAKMALLVSFIFSVACLLFYFVTTLIAMTFMTPAALGFMVTSFIEMAATFVLSIELLLLNTHKKMAYDSIANGTRNPRALRHRSLFFLGACWTITTIITSAYLSWFDILIGLPWKVPFIVGYLGQALTSCTPLPPQPKKSGVKTAGTIPRKKTAPVAVPVPEGNRP